MKEKYTKPIANIEVFQTLDVITTSGDIQPGDTDVSLGDKNYLSKFLFRIFISVIKTLHLFAFCLTLTADYVTLKVR